MDGRIKAGERNQVILRASPGITEGEVTTRSLTPPDISRKDVAPVNTLSNEK